MGGGAGDGAGILADTGGMAKFDLDMAREILLEMEKQPYTGRPCRIEIAGVEPMVVQYHLLILIEDGLLEGHSGSDLNGHFWCWPTRLTAQGHRFVNDARNKDLWARAKTRMLEATGTLSLEGLKAVMAEIVRQAALRG